MSSRQHFLLLAFLVLLSTTCAIPQIASPAPDGCAMPTGLRSTSGKNMFSEQQEEWLGEIMEKEIRSDFNVIGDPDNYLQKVADRLVAQLPPSHTHYHFLIIDSPDLNSFGLVGGRIFIHRRMIAFARNEDELAALLGHEMGHMVDHHVALRISDWFRQLEIPSLGDRQDVFNRWKQFEDNAHRVKRRQDEHREEQEQLIADRIALYAIARAGYNPERAIDFFDRLFETKHKTGNFWTDFFGVTNPAAKRLRELMKNERPLAQSCIFPRPDDSSFTKWQALIIGSSKNASSGDREIPGLIRKVALQQPLRTDLYHIQFSHDGKYLLAQDATSIFLATREPLANLFRIDAVDAHAAQFTPDSRSIVFYDKEFRVERWDLATQQRTSVHQLTIPECLQAALSPSGTYLGCIDYRFNLKLVEVATDKVLVDRKSIYTFTSYFEWLRFFTALLTEEENFRFFEMKFSPDDEYFLFGHRQTFFAYDTRDRLEVHLPGRIKGLGEMTFAFTAPDELVGLTYYSDKERKITRVRFPSGEKIDDFKIQADGWLSATPSGDYLLMRPAGAYPVGVVDLKNRNITSAFKSPAFAVYGQIFAGEQNSGEVGLFNQGDKKMIGRWQLPESRLGPSRVSAFSADGKWLAVSQGSRGSLWKLDTGQRMFLSHGFDGALFENDLLTTEFAQDPPNVARVFQFDLAANTNKKLFDVDFEGKSPNARSWQWGSLLVDLRPEKEKKEISAGRPTIEVRDVHTNNVLWQRKLHSARPRFYYTPTAITELISDWSDIKSAANEDADLTARLSKVDGKQDAYLFQALEPATGKLLGSVVVDTGKLSFHVLWGYTFGDTMFVGDSNNRTLMYSLKTGQQKGAFIGHLVAASANGERALIENESGVADLYDTGSTRPLQHFNFGSRLVDASFFQNGSLLVLTADQNVYQLTTNPEKESSGAQ